MEYERGIEILEDIVKDDSLNEMVLYNLALAYNSIGKSESAIKTFKIY